MYAIAIGPMVSGVIGSLVYYYRDRSLVPVAVIVWILAGESADDHHDLHRRRGLLLYSP